MTANYKNLVTFLLISLLASGGVFGQSGVNIQTGVANALIGSDGARASASLGLNVFADERSLLFIPGIHYVKMSLYPNGQHDMFMGYRIDPAMHFGKVQLYIGKRFSKNKRYNVRLYGGGYTQLLFKVDHNPDAINEEYYQMGTFGIEGGVGVRIFLLTLDIKYTQGLTKLYSTGADDRHRGLGFYAGLFF